MRASLKFILSCSEMVCPRAPPPTSRSVLEPTFRSRSQSPEQQLTGLRRDRTSSTISETRRSSFVATGGTQVKDERPPSSSAFMLLINPKPHLPPEKLLSPGQSLKCSASHETVLLVSFQHKAWWEWQQERGGGGNEKGRD